VFVYGREASSRALAGALLALALLLICGGLAAAKPKPQGGGGGGSQCGVNTSFLCVQGGSTKLTFSSSWLTRIRQKGWRLRAISPAVKRGNVLEMPIVKRGKLTSFRRSRVGGQSTMNPGGECLTDGGLTVLESAIHHAGGFALRRRGVRRPFDALVLRGNTFYWRGPDHRSAGAKGPSSGTFGGEWHGNPGIDGITSSDQGRTVINALRVTEVQTLESGAELGPVKGVMGKTDSSWRVNPYCQLVVPDPEPPPEVIGE
jgi:hypothetical protein